MQHVHGPLHPYTVRILSAPIRGPFKGTYAAESESVCLICLRRCLPRQSVYLSKFITITPPRTCSNDTDGFPMNAPLPNALWKRWTARILHPSIQQDVSNKMVALRRVPFCSLLFWIHLALGETSYCSNLGRFSRLRIGLSHCQLIPDRFREKVHSHVSLSSDRRLIASAYIYWCVVLFPS